MISRRVLFAGVGGAAILSACGKSGSSAPTTSVDPGFAQPFASLASAEVTALGTAVLVEAPQSIDHARAALASTRTSIPSALTKAYAADAAADALVDVGGWLVPASLAGLAGGLAALEQGRLKP